MNSSKAIVTWVLSLTMIWSCNNQPTVIYTQTDSTKTDTTNALIARVHDAILEDTVADIQFEELTVSIHRLVVFDEDKKLSKAQKDTAYVYADIGETPEGEVVSIATDQLTNLTVAQRYQTSISISDEGPHCDLLDWKHYDSEWMPLKSNQQGQFICHSYSKKEQEQFPTIQIGELKQYVKKNCGEECFNGIAKIKSPTQAPSAVGISRYFLRVTGQRKDTGQTVTKWIIIDVPMGC